MKFDNSPKILENLNLRALLLFRERLELWRISHFHFSSTTFTFTLCSIFLELGSFIFSVSSSSWKSFLRQLLSQIFLLHLVCQQPYLPIPIWIQMHSLNHRLSLGSSLHRQALLRTRILSRVRVMKECHWFLWFPHLQSHSSSQTSSSFVKSKTKSPYLLSRGLDSLLMRPRLQKGYQTEESLWDLTHRILRRKTLQSKRLTVLLLSGFTIEEFLADCQTSELIFEVSLNW